jgi:hypothetical protein
MGMELRLGLGPGFLILGPKRMHEMAGYLSRTRAQWAKADRGLQSELEAELGPESSAPPRRARTQSPDLRPILAASGSPSGADAGSPLTS